MGRLATMARFDESIPEPAAVAVCDYDCGNPVYDGEEVVRTYEGEIVHADCWREYCDEMYAEWRGAATPTDN